MPFFRLPQPEQFPGGALFHAIVGRVGTDVLPAASPWQAAQCSIAYPTPPPQTELPGRLQAHLAERGIRMMQQRRAILCVMETASNHLDASQILRKAQKIDASVDRSTVPHVATVKTAGTVDELDL